MDLNVEQCLLKLQSELENIIADLTRADVILVGIHTGGVWIAEKLHTALNIPSELGILDISFYRDDFSRLGLNPQVKPSKLPLDITDKHIILVDDVLYTGRTVRAAMNELFDYGRPASVQLAVLIDRGGRELPISASAIGLKIDLADHQHLKLTGPAPLCLEMVTTDRDD